MFKIVTKRNNPKWLITHQSFKESHPEALQSMTDKPQNFFI